MTDRPEFITSFEGIVQHAWVANQERAEELRQISERWRDEGLVSDDQRQLGAQLAHSVKGSAGIFGHPDAAGIALEIEQMMLSEDGPGYPPRLHDLVAELRESLQQPPRPDL